MNTSELIPLQTTIDGLAGNTISLYGPESLNYPADFDHNGVALVPLDVAATSTETPGFQVGAEHFDLVANYNARQLELARSPIPTYDPGPMVDLHIADLAGVNGLTGLEMIAGDNLPVVFDGEGKTRCGEKTAQTFLEFYPKAVITPQVSVALPTLVQTPSEQTPPGTGAPASGAPASSAPAAGTPATGTATDSGAGNSTPKTSKPKGTGTRKNSASTGGASTGDTATGDASASDSTADQTGAGDTATGSDSESASSEVASGDAQGADATAPANAETNSTEATPTETTNGEAATATA